MVYWPTDSFTHSYCILVACHYVMSVYVMSCTVHNKHILSFTILSVARIVQTPRLDATLKLLVPKTTSGHDNWLQKIQALAVDTYAPIVALLNRAEGNPPSDEETRGALRCSLKLMGNLFARLSQERQRKILCSIHKDLGHMAEEKFKDPQSLFGEEIVDRVKKRHDALKSLRQPSSRGRCPEVRSFWASGNPRCNHFKKGKFPKKFGT